MRCSVGSVDSTLYLCLGIYTPEPFLGTNARTVIAVIAARGPLLSALTWLPRSQAPRANQSAARDAALGMLSSLSSDDFVRAAVPRPPHEWPPRHPTTTLPDLPFALVQTRRRDAFAAVPPATTSHRLRHPRRSANPHASSPFTLDPPWSGPPYRLGAHGNGLAGLCKDDWRNGVVSEGQWI